MTAKSLLNSHRNLKNDLHEFVLREKVNAILVFVYTILIKNKSLPETEVRKINFSLCDSFSNNDLFFSSKDRMHYRLAKRTLSEKGFKIKETADKPLKNSSITWLVWEIKEKKK